MGGGSIYHEKQGYKYRLPESCQGRGPNVRNCKKHNWNHLICLRLEYTIFIQEVFKSHLKKITSTQSDNSHPKLQFDLCPSYINLLHKWLNPPPPPPPIGCGGGGGGGSKLKIIYKTSHPIYNTLIPYNEASFETLLRI